MNNIALFLDLDNFTISARHAKLTFDIDLLLSYIEERIDGRIVLRRAYGDSRQNHRLLRQLATAGFVIQATVDVSGYGKNLADMQIVVEAMETLITGHPYDTYVLITGDRDFTPLVQCLRQHGKRVVGVGVKHTASFSLANLCDEYIFYKAISSVEQPTELQIRELLAQALDQLLAEDVPCIQASVLKQRMSDLSNNNFDHAAYSEGNFRQFLSNFPDLVEIKHEETTTFVCRPQVQPEALPLHLKYRTGLKKQRLRVVLPAELRITILKDMVATLRRDPEMQWRTLLESLFDYYMNLGMSEVSKNTINDMMLLARRSQVIRTLKGSSLATAPVKLQLSSDKPIKEAVIYCDAAYLQAIQSLTEPFDIKEAALALYDSIDYVAYLKIVMQKYRQNNKEGDDEETGYDA
jgi:uncharacterized protein (TIGR00288 family)